MAHKMMAVKSSSRKCQNKTEKELRDQVTKINKSKINVK